MLEDEKAEQDATPDGDSADVSSPPVSLVIDTRVAVTDQCYIIKYIIGE